MKGNNSMLKQLCPISLECCWVPKSLWQALPEAIKAALQVRAQLHRVEERDCFLQNNAGGQKLGSVPVHA